MLKIFIYRTLKELLILERSMGYLTNPMPHLDDKEGLIPTIVGDPNKRLFIHDSPGEGEKPMGKETEALAKALEAYWRAASNLRTELNKVTQNGAETVKL